MPDHSHSTQEELLIGCFMILPLLLLAAYWSQLPDQVPIHWDWRLQPDNYASKHSYWIATLVIQLPLYFLLRFLPFKKRDQQNPPLSKKKYTRLRVILHAFLAMIHAIVILHVINKAGLEMLPYCFLIFMLLFGNYMGSLSPNRYIGIRLPWTIKYPTVWKKVHELGGKIWVGTSILGLLLLPQLSSQLGLALVLTLLLGSTLGLAIYSYLLAKEEGFT